MADGLDGLNSHTASISNAVDGISEIARGVAPGLKFESRALESPDNQFPRLHQHQKLFGVVCGKR
jgi:hypothetical protein